MSERPASRADLRAGAWRFLWWQHVSGHAAAAEAIADTLRCRLGWRVPEPKP